MARSAERVVTLNDDGETGWIHSLPFHNRTLHRQLATIEGDQQAAVLLDVLDIGAEVLDRAGRHGDLESLSHAVERLDQEAKRIVSRAVEQVDRSIEKSVAEMARTLQREDGPFAAVLERFDLATDGNVIDLFRELVSTTAAKATKQAVKELNEGTQDTVERLTRSMAIIEKVAAAEEARWAEAQRGTAKGIDHEFDTESLLGEFVSVGGDSLNDVSTVVGERGTKKGDKTIIPRGGCTVVTEEKCTARISESKARSILDEAMENRCAQLGMLIVDDETKVPGNQPFHLIDDDKVVVVAERAPLRLVYALFRAKAIEIVKAKSCSPGDQLIAESVYSIRRLVEETGRALERFKLLRTEHTKATKAIGQAGRYVEEMAATIGDSVNEIMATIDRLAGNADSGIAA